MRIFNSLNRQQMNPAASSRELSVRLNSGSGRQQNRSSKGKESGWEQAGEKLLHFGAGER